MKDNEEEQRGREISLPTIVPKAKSTNTNIHTYTSIDEHVNIEHQLFHYLDIDNVVSDWDFASLHG